MVLKVIVVGGGIAGLASTTALRRAGHNVTILERSQRFDNEVGAAIHVPPNSTRPLIAWGFDVVRARLVRFKHNLFADGKTLEVQWLAEKDTKLIDDVYGGPWMAAHRVDLHEELRRLAFAEPAAVDDAWGTVEVRLGAEVVAYVSVFLPWAPSRCRLHQLSCCEINQRDNAHRAQRLRP